MLHLYLYLILRLFIIRVGGVIGVGKLVVDHSTFKTAEGFGDQESRTQEMKGALTGMSRQVDDTAGYG